MNVENMRKLRDTIAESETYDQGRFFHECGTPACLAGHAVMLSKAEAPVLADWKTAPVEYIVGYAAAWLGITGGQSISMFAGEPCDDRSATKREALDMLNRAIKTGEIEWREE